MMHPSLPSWGAVLVFCATTVFAYAAWIIATGERAARVRVVPEPTLPLGPAQPESVLPLSDDMREAIWNEVQASIAISREEDERREREHQLIRKSIPWRAKRSLESARREGMLCTATVDELMPNVVEVDR